MKKRKSAGRKPHSESIEPTISLPPGWAFARVGDVLHLINGFAFKPAHWSTNGLPIIRIQNLNNPDAPFNHFEDELDAKYRVKDGDLLFAWSGTPGTSFGAHVWNRGDAWLNQHIYRVEFDRQLLNTDFIRHAINQNLTEYIEKAHGGAGLAHITKREFESSCIALAPIAEQRRIAETLEHLLQRVRTVRERLLKVPLLIQRFRQSVLSAACSGKLTADWRTNHPYENSSESDAVEELCHTPEEWAWNRLESLSDESRGICYGVIKLGQSMEDGVPCLRTSNVKPLRIDTENVKRISKSISDDYQRSILRGGELLVNVRGTLGGVAVVPSSFEGWNVSREVAVVPVVSAEPQFIALWVASTASRHWLTRVAKGVAYTGINLSDLRLLPVPVPSRAEQQEIIQRTQELLSFADHLENRFKNAQSSVDQITRSLLARAFRGELVVTEHDLAESEGRIYETAKELVARIEEGLKVSRKATSKKKSGAKMTRPKKTLEPKNLAETLSASKRPMRPETLLDKAGFDEESIDDFYRELRNAIAAGEIEESRPNESDVLLMTVKK